MDCERFDQLVDLHLTNELETAQDAALREHAEQCGLCRRRLLAAQSSVDRLSPALEAVRLPDDFTLRTLARVLKEAQARPEPEEALPPESLPRRILRHSAMAAAAVLFLLAGYGFLHRPSIARVRKGQVGLASLDGAAAARSLGPGSPLSTGDVLRTAEGANAVVDLASGRMRAVLGPNTRIRIGDPRRGIIAYVDRGDLYWRVHSSVGAPVVGSPLAHVAAADGTVSLHVSPVPRPGRPSPTFRGVVTLTSHEGVTRVLLPGRDARVMTLRPGQVVTLCSDTGPGVPCTFDDVRRRLQERLQELERNRAQLEGQWQAISQQVRSAPAEALPRLFHDGERTRNALARAGAIHAEILRRIGLLDRYSRQSRVIFQAELRTAAFND